MTGLQEASQDLTHHGKGKDDEPEHEPGKHHHPPLAEDHELGTARDHRAEFGRRRTDARADEAQPGGEQNRETDRYRHLDEHIGPRVRQQMPKTDAEIGIADRLRRLGERSVAQRKHLGAHEAQEYREIHECDREQHVHRPGTADGDQHHREDEHRERLQNIEEAQPDFRRPVQPAPGMPSKYPANAPRPAPIATDSAVATSAIVTSVRGAASRREKTSMPFSSVPNRCFALGGASRWLGSAITVGQRCQHRAEDGEEQDDQERPEDNPLERAQPAPDLAGTSRPCRGPAGVDARLGTIALLTGLGSLRVRALADRS